MSNAKTIKAKCNQCGCEWTTEIWPIIDEDADPEAVQLIYDDLFFFHYCPDCNKQFCYTEPFVYYNKNKRAMICFVEGMTNVSMANTFMQELIEQMDIDMSAFHIRLTTTMNDFREKVMLLRDGLDDRVIEIMKLFGLDIVRKEGHKQEFDETHCCINPENGKLTIDFMGQQPRNIQFDMEIYDRIRNRLKTVLDKAKIPLEVNADWAINFVEKNE